MRYYFFDVNRDRDRCGKELPDLRAARAEARHLLSAAIDAADLQPGEYQAWSCTVRDERDATLLRIVIATLVEGQRMPENGIRTFHPA